MLSETGNRFDQNPETTPSPEMSLDQAKRSVDGGDGLSQKFEKHLAPIIEAERAQAESEDLEILEESKNQISLIELWQRVKDRIVDATPNFVVNEDRVINEYARHTDRSIRLGREAGQLFNFLAEHGLKKPDKPHVDFGWLRVSQLESERDAYIKAMQHIRTTSPSKSEVLKAQEQLLADERKQGSEKNFENRNEKKQGEYVHQIFRHNIEQEGGSNIIQENVFSRLYSDRNVSIAKLTVRNQKTGQSLELDQLLPEGYHFVPEEMRRVEDELVKVGEGKNQRMEVHQKISPVNLRDYRGAQDTEGRFYAAPGGEIVAYGNLTRHGGMLSLLHEIAHAWQSKYHEVEARQNWRDFYVDVTTTLHVLSEQQKGNIAARKNGEEGNEATEALVKRFLKKRLARFGVEIEENYDASDAKQVPAGMYELRSGPSRFHVKSEKIKSLAEDFVREERDAWARALRVLRFLRKRGFDLEPDLQSLDSIRFVVDYCLGTYQAHIERRLKPEKNIRKFTRRSRYHPKDISIYEED